MLNPWGWDALVTFCGLPKKQKRRSEQQGMTVFLAPGMLRLLSQVELSDDRTVALDVVLLQVAQKVSSVADHLLQTSAAVEILGVSLEVLGQVSNSGSQDCDLNLGRTGVALVDGIGLNNLLLFILLHGHGSIHLSKIKFFVGGQPRDRRVNVHGIDLCDVRKPS